MRTLSLYFITHPDKVETLWNKEYFAPLVSLVNFQMEEEGRGEGGKGGVFVKLHKCVQSEEKAFNGKTCENSCTLATQHLTSMGIILVVVRQLPAHSETQPDDEQGNFGRVIVIMYLIMCMNASSLSMKKSGHMNKVCSL